SSVKEDSDPGSLSRGHTRNSTLRDMRRICSRVSNTEGPKARYGCPESPDTGCHSCVRCGRNPEDMANTAEPPFVVIISTWIWIWLLLELVAPLRSMHAIIIASVVGTLLVVVAAIVGPVESCWIFKIQRIVKGVGVRRHTVANLRHRVHIPRTLHHCFGLQVSADARVVEAVPVFEQVRLGVEILPGKAQRRPKGDGTGLEPSELVSFQHGAIVREVRSLRTGAVQTPAPIGTAILCLRKQRRPARGRL